MEKLNEEIKDIDTSYVIITKDEIEKLMSDMKRDLYPEPTEEDIKEMEEMLKIAYSEGIRCIIATPHHHPRRGKESPEVLRKKAALLRKSAHEIDEHFRIYLGTEIFFGQDVLEKLKEELDVAQASHTQHVSEEKAKLEAREKTLATAEKGMCDAFTSFE